MNKFIYLIGHYIKKKIFTKQFLWANLFILVFLLLLFNIDTILNSLDKDNNREYNLIIKDNIGITDIIDGEFNNIDKDIYNINVKYSDLSVDEIKKDIDKSEDVLIVINEDIDNYFDVEIISYDNIDNIYNTIKNVLYNTKIKYALNTYNISLEELEKIESNVNIKRTILKESARNSKSIDIMLGVTASIIMLPSLMLIIYLVQMIGTSINQEKSSHSMEIILSNVNAKTHFWAQIISSNLFILIQSILMGLFSSIGLIIRFMFNNGSRITEIPNNMNISSISSESINVDSNMIMEFINRIPSILLVIIVMTFLSFVAYSMLAAILSSVTTTIEDFNNIEGPIMILVFGGFYISLIAGLYPDSIILKVLSLIPFLSFVISPTLYALGGISIYYVIGSIFTLLITIFIFIRYGINIYREGLLNYEGTMVWKRLFNVIKKK